MKLASFPVVRSAIAGFGFAFLAVACSAQSGECRRKKFAGY